MIEKRRHQIFHKRLTIGQSRNASISLAEATLVGRLDRYLLGFRYVPMIQTIGRLS